MSLIYFRVLIQVSMPYSKHVIKPRKAAATLEPEPTQYIQPTFVWAYIARQVWLHLMRHVCPELQLLQLYYHRTSRFICTEFSL
jgi:hypothetical protein